MKNKLNIMKTLFTILGLFSLILFSCQDVLDKHDLTKLDERIWEDPVQIKLYINTLYAKNMPGASFAENSALSDETFSTGDNIIQLMYGFSTPNDINAVTDLHKDVYSDIRHINIGLEGIKNSSIDDSTKAVLAGQALFLRTFRYWKLVRLYGGIPIIKEVQDPYDGADALNIPRPKTSEAINDLIEDLDIAIESLPLEWKVNEDRGRITSVAAAAFKGRILLTWASPLFNPGNNEDRWKRAYEANKEAIHLSTQMTTPRSLVPEFKSIFTKPVLDNEEAIIFRRYSLGVGSDYTHGWEGDVRPSSGGGDSKNAPTWELVQAFPMANGKLINEPGSGYDKDVFWKNRDPRFYATIAYNGCEWPMNGRERLPIWCFRNVVEGNKQPATGFYNKKATDPSINIDDVGQTSTSWLELRYAEVLLNFAECANEIGSKDEALENIRLVRARAGIEAGGGEYGIPNSVSKEELREIIMVERQVEFAFENKRYWDLRRRKMFSEDLGIYVKKLNGTQRHGLNYKALGPYGRPIADKSSPFFGWLPIDTAYQNGSIDLLNFNNFSNYFSSSLIALDKYANEHIVLNYKELYYFFAVPQAFIDNSPAIEQTAGWLEGTYDPLAE